MVTIHLNTPTNHLAIELQHISKKYPILSVFYRYQKRFKYHMLARLLNHVGLSLCIILNVSIAILLNLLTLSDGIFDFSSNSS